MTESKLTISGGCQLQPLPYALQLLHKKKTVSLAYSRFSALNPSLIPEIQPTIGSPKQWGYRTKITPHFDAPPKAARAAKEAKDAQKAQEMGEEEGMNQDTEGKRDWECRIGFERKGRPGVLDIEVCLNFPRTSISHQGGLGDQADLQECPIATPVINSKMIEERQRVKESVSGPPLRGYIILIHHHRCRLQPLFLNPLQTSHCHKSAHSAYWRQ